MPVRMKLIKDDTPAAWLECPKGGLQAGASIWCDCQNKVQDGGIEHVLSGQGVMDTATNFLDHGRAASAGR